MNQARVAAFAGTFDPITNGHLDIARRAAVLFDRLIFAVAEENYKPNLFSTEERCRLAQEALADLPQVEVRPFRGLLSDFCREAGVTHLVRGMRSAADFDLEQQIVMLNRHYVPEVDTVFLLAGDDLSYISSSVIRNTARSGGDVSHLVPPCVAAALAAKGLGRAAE